MNKNLPSIDSGDSSSSSSSTAPQRHDRDATRMPTSVVRSNCAPLSSKSRLFPAGYRYVCVWLFRLVFFFLFVFAARQNEETISRLRVDLETERTKNQTLQGKMDLMREANVAMVRIPSFFFFFFGKHNPLLIYIYHSNSVPNSRKSSFPTSCSDASRTSSAKRSSSCCKSSKKRST